MAKKQLNIGSQLQQLASISPGPSIPIEFQDHPKVKDRLFYTLPGKLIRLLVDALDEVVAQDAWQLELGMSQASPSPNVGFWSGHPIICDRLRQGGDDGTLPKRPASLVAGGPLESEKTKEETAYWEKLKQAAPAANRALDEARLPLIAYAGWLNTNAQFLKEHDELFRKHPSLVEKFGIPRCGTAPQFVDAASNQIVASPYEKTRDPKVIAFADDFEKFYVRWRLQGLAGPYLPEPLPPMLPVLAPRLILGHMREAGLIFYLPDTYPVPSRDALRDLIGNEIDHVPAPSDHLKDWQKIISTGSQAKNQLKSHARRFRLVHYWCAFYGRHHEQLVRRRTRTASAFAIFLGVSEELIRRDLQAIDNKLGSAWELRLAPQIR